MLYVYRSMEGLRPSLKFPLSHTFSALRLSLDGRASPKFEVSPLTLSLLYVYLSMEGLQPSLKFPLSHTHFLCFMFISRWKGFSQVWSFFPHTHFLCFMFLARWKGISQVWSSPLSHRHTFSLLKKRWYDMIIPHKRTMCMWTFLWFLA